MEYHNRWTGGLVDSFVWEVIKGLYFYFLIYTIVHSTSPVIDGTLVGLIGVLYIAARLIYLKRAGDRVSRIGSSAGYGTSNYPYVCSTCEKETIRKTILVTGCACSGRLFEYQTPNPGFACPDGHVKYVSREDVPAIESAWTEFLESDGAVFKRTFYVNTEKLAQDMSALSAGLSRIDESLTALLDDSHPSEDPSDLSDILPELREMLDDMTDTFGGSSPESTKDHR